MPWCPKCKAEYREGFTECNTCHVPLVDELPAEEVSDHAGVVLPDGMEKPIVIYTAKTGWRPKRSAICCMTTTL